MALYSPSAIPSEPPPSSSSSLFREKKYDVYLSFSCNDTRKNFAGPLYKAMKRARIKVFRDNTELQDRENISEKLLEAIECSNISVIIFSKDYAASRRCLEEVEKIYECWKKFQQPVLAIIFKDFLEEFGKHNGRSATKKMKGFWSDLSSPRGPQSVDAPPRWWSKCKGTLGKDERDFQEYLADILIIVEYFQEYLKMKEKEYVKNFEEYFEKKQYYEEWCRNGREINELTVSGKEIARGSNGTIVYEGYYSGREVAVKRLLMDHSDMAFKEILNLTESDEHPNIVRLYGKEIDRDFVYLALQLCNCNLADLIQIYSKDYPSQNTQFSQKYKDRLDSVKESMEESIRDIKLWEASGRPSPRLLELMRDVVSGLVYLHKKKIIHRDLKPQNVLIIIEEESLRAKLSDMGISKSLPPNMSSLGTQATACGTLGWRAPEQILGGVLGGRQTRAVDLFSLGCVLFFCITGGKHPFGDNHVDREMNIRNKQKADLSAVEHIPEAMDLFSHLLNPDPKLRPKALKVLEHPLFWDSNKRQSFVYETCEWVDLEAKKNTKKRKRKRKLKALSNSNDPLKALDDKGPLIFGAEWETKVDPAFIKNILVYRGYDFKSVRDLLRAIRNKKGHYKGLPKDVKDILGPYPEGYDDYFASRFPKLLIEVYRVVGQYCKGDKDFQEYLKFNV